MDKNKPTKDQFNSYVAIQRSGVTNMFDVPTVIKLSGNKLTREIILYIFKNYADLCEEYDIHY